MAMAEAVVADGGVGQRHGHALGVGRAHVLADMAHLFGVAAVGLQVGREVHHRLVIAPLGGEQQPLGVEVVHDGDVALPAMQTGVVDAHDLHRAHVVERAGLIDIVLDAPPQLLVGTAQQCRGLAHRKLPAQRQRQGLEQRGEARAFARPGHACLPGLAELAQATRGASACNQASNWKKSRCRHERRKRSWMRCSAAPQ
jgi:hypothetical protein